MKPSTCLAHLALLLACQLLSGVAGAATGQQDTSRQAADSAIHARLLALEQQRVGAILRRDVATLRTLMDRSYYHVVSSGRVRSKTDLLTALDRNEFRFLSYESESTDIHVLPGGDSAIVTGTFHLAQDLPASKPFRGRYMRVWVRQPDGWKNTFHQSTEIRPAQDNCQCD